ncbi:unnamed protein product [Cuscuta campestris]|uniref:BAG domain-containing protein n=1 Tax=Cuscuta campestris TaxID=132261 RepID=A0A484NLG1_9ASTE|nr:unnamed protein product [Cuscuta campestris]
MLKIKKTHSATAAAVKRTFPPAETNGSRGSGAAARELRPGGMLVQKRSCDCNNQSSSPGFKDGSKPALMEEAPGVERPHFEARKPAKMAVPSKEITAIRVEIDRLAKQVGDVEMEAYGGKKVGEGVIMNMIELLMNQLLKLDGISAEGDDVKVQRRMQVKRVQKYIQNLDLLRTGHSTLESNNNNTVNTHTTIFF